MFNAALMENCLTPTWPLRPARTTFTQNRFHRGGSLVESGAVATLSSSRQTSRNPVPGSPRRFRSDVIRRALAQFRRLQRESFEAAIKDHLYRPLGNGTGSDELRDPHYQKWQRDWQVFRGRVIDLRLEADGVFEDLHQLDIPFRGRTLSDFAAGDIAPTLATLFCLCDLRRTGRAPTLMSATRFLHYWNPRMFVQMDKARMQEWVIRHEWISESVEEIEQWVQEQIPAEDQAMQSFQGWFPLYLAMQLWCAETLRGNPEIKQNFARLLDEELPASQRRQTVGQYESLAIEWFLLGVTHLPPR